MCQSANYISKEKTKPLGKNPSI